jgi:hypothetical protein
MAPFLSQYMPTLYWGIFSPSFCVGGPCGPWFGTDWGWSDGWDWDAGTWQANSDRGRYGFKDPSYYNQVGDYLWDMSLQLTLLFTVGSVSSWLELCSPCN